MAGMGMGMAPSSVSGFDSPFPVAASPYTPCRFQSSHSPQPEKESEVYGFASGAMMDASGAMDVDGVDVVVPQNNASLGMPRTTTNRVDNAAHKSSTSCSQQTSTHTPVLGAIPRDILKNVFCFLQLRDLATASNVCREWREVIVTEKNVVFGVCPAEAVEMGIGTQTNASLLPPGVLYVLRVAALAGVTTCSSMLGAQALSLGYVSKALKWWRRAAREGDRTAALQAGLLLIRTAAARHAKRSKSYANLCELALAGSAAAADAARTQHNRDDEDSRQTDVDMKPCDTDTATADYKVPAGPFGTPSSDDALHLDSWADMLGDTDTEVIGVMTQAWVKAVADGTAAAGDASLLSEMIALFVQAAHPLCKDPAVTAEAAVMLSRIYGARGEKEHARQWLVLGAARGSLEARQLLAAANNA